MVIALAPILAVMVVEAVQTAKAAPTVVVPIVAAVTAASNRFVEVSVAVESQRLAQRELYDHYECAARCTTQ